MEPKKFELDHRKIKDAALAMLYHGYDKETGQDWKSY